MARVLVVDDSSIMRRNLSAILENAGHTIVAEAANGELAFKEFEKHKPDLVTMDITMPVLDGIGAVKKIIGFYPEAQIIMISALDQKFMVLSAIQNGARHYIIKPFSVEKVIEIVNEVLSSSQGKPSKKIGKPLQQPNKKPDSPNLINTTITDINQSINNINAAIQTLDAEPDEEK
ncbi:MAG TPA: response regulator [Clostridia bacterium]|nr:response regulator [Clostridia bacterium]